MIQVERIVKEDWPQRGLDIELIDGDIFSIVIYDLYVNDEGYVGCDLTREQAQKLVDVLSGVLGK